MEKDHFRWTTGNHLVEEWPIHDSVKCGGLMSAAVGKPYFERIQLNEGTLFH